MSPKYTPGAILLFIIPTAGYREIVGIVRLLHENCKYEKTLFSGRENVISDRLCWMLYGLFRNVTPAFVHFSEQPAEKIPGVITRVVI